MNTLGGEIELPAELVGRLDGPIRLADVGARGGLEPPWPPIAGRLEAIGFEPAAEAFEHLLRTAPPNVTYLNVALDAHPGEVTLYLTQGASDASIFRPNAVFLDAFEIGEGFEVIGTTTCAVDTLDAALERAGVDQVDFVKLDTQGSELPILEGAERTLARYVFGVETEVSFNSIYDGQPLFGALDAFLRGHDYELFELKPKWCLRYSGGGLREGGRGQHVWGDALYLKGPRVVRDRLAGFDEALRTQELVKLVIVCLLYGLGDYALELIDGAGIATADAARLGRAVRRYDERCAATFGIEYTFALPQELAGTLHKHVRGRGARQHHRSPEWLAVRAVRRWLDECAPSSPMERARRTAAALTGRRTRP